MKDSVGQFDKINSMTKFFHKTADINESSYWKKIFKKVQLP